MVQKNGVQLNQPGLVENTAIAMGSELEPTRPCSNLHGFAETLEMAARACLQVAGSLDMAARAYLGTAMVLRA